MKALLRIILSAALALLPLQAWAASGATTVGVLDGGGTSRTVNVYSSTGAVTGNLSWMNTICDFTTLTQCTTVDSSNNLHVDAPSGSALLSALQAAVPCLNATSYNTNSYSTGQTNPVNCGLNGNLYVAQGTPSGNASAWWEQIGDGTNGPVAVKPSGTPPTSTDPALVTTLRPGTYYSLIAANSTNSTNVKNAAGILLSLQTGNINASTPYYLKLYDSASAPTCGSGTPVKRILIPQGNSGNNVSIPNGGTAFTSGIGFCVTAGIGDSDTTAVPASTVLVNIDYK